MSALPPINANPTPAGSLHASSPHAGRTAARHIPRPQPDEQRLVERILRRAGGASLAFGALLAIGILNPAPGAAQPIAPVPSAPTDRASSGATAMVARAVRPTDIARTVPHPGMRQVINAGQLSQPVERPCDTGAPPSCRLVIIDMP